MRRHTALKNLSHSSWLDLRRDPKSNCQRVLRRLRTRLLSPVTPCSRGQSHGSQRFTSVVRIASRSFPLWLRYSKKRQNSLYGDAFIAQDFLFRPRLFFASGKRGPSWFV